MAQFHLLSCNIPQGAKKNQEPAGLDSQFVGQTLKVGHNK